MFGYLAGLIGLPHPVESARVRSATVTPSTCTSRSSTSIPSRPAPRVVQIEEKDHLFIAVSGQVNVHLRLGTELTARRPQ